MNRVTKRLAIAGLLVMFACTGSGSIETATTGCPDVRLLNLTYTLQGVVADAITGARIGGDLKMFLVQGSTIRGPTRLTTSATDPLAGEYAFTGIPLEFRAGDSVWKVVVVKTGYQRFESEITFTADLPAACTAIVDTVYSKIGNIFLFPVGFNAPDQSFTTVYNNKPVPGATVELIPTAGANSAAVSTGSGDTLFNTSGYLGTLSVQTDPTGKATFLGSTMALGAEYHVVVLPVIFTDSAGDKIQLQTFPEGTTTTVTTFTEGFSDVIADEYITLSDLSTFGNGFHAFVTNASNFATNQIQANGQLILSLSTPISVVNPNCFNAALVPGSNSTGSAAGAGVLSATQPVNTTLSADGLTLTFAPNYSTAPAATDRGVNITYANGPPAGSTACPGATPLAAFAGAIVEKDYPATSHPVFGAGGLKFSDGATLVNPTVVITGP